MMFALQRLGKQVTVIAGDSELPQTMAHLSGFDQIVPKNYFEIKPEEFDLFLILDSSKKNHISQKGEVFFPSSMRTVVIDHHMQDEFYGQINLVDSNYPAVAQMLFDLFEEWQIAISNEIAVCLMLGLYADTGGFKYPRTTTESFLMAARLAEVNPDFPGVIFDYENNNEPEKIRFLGLALSSIKLYFNGRIALSEVTSQVLQEQGIEYQHTRQTEISNYLKSVKDWEIGVSLIGKRADEVVVNFRTRDYQRYDVSKIANILGGGGHPAAAGATIKKPIGEAKEFLLATIQQVFPELGKP